MSSIHLLCLLPLDRSPGTHPCMMAFLGIYISFWLYVLNNTELLTFLSEIQRFVFSPIAIIDVCVFVCVCVCVRVCVCVGVCVYVCV